MEKTGWLLIPPYILARDDLSKTDKFVFGRILGLTNQTGFCFATNEYLAESLFVSPITVAHSISVLVQKKFLIRKFIRSEENPFLITERQLFIGKSADVENDNTGDAEIDNTHSPNEQDHIYKLNKENIKENPQKETSENADIGLSDFQNLPEDYVIKMALHHRLFKQVVRQEAQAAYNWVILKKAQKKYSDWNRFLHNWLSKRSVKEHAGEVPGIYSINLEEGTLRRYHNEDGTVRVVSTYQEDLDEIKAGTMKPEDLVENQLIELRKLKESGVTLTKVQEIDLADAEQSVPIRKNVHEKWLKGDYAGY